MTRTVAATRDSGLAPAAQTEPPLRLGIGRRLRAWVWFHRRSFLLVLPVLATGVVVHAWGVGAAPVPFDDEGTYVAQAWAVQSGRGLAHYTYWYDHPPLGWVQLAGWTWLTDAFDRTSHAIVAGRQAMVGVAAVAGGLLYVVARRLELRRLPAVGALALFMLSPLAVAQHRMVLLDNIAVPWLLGAMALALSPRRSLWAAAASGACAGVAVLTKETFLLLMPAVAFLLWRQCHRKTRQFCMTAFVVTFGAVVLAYPLYALLKGELLPGPDHVSLLDAIRFQILERPGSGSLLDASSAARDTVDGWLVRDHLLLLAGALAAIPALLVPRLRPVVVGAGVLVAVAFRGGYLPGPHVVAALPLAALLVAGVFDEAWSRATDQRSTDRPVVSSLPLLAVAGCAAILALVAVPPWVAGNRELVTDDAASTTWAAEDWIAEHVDPDEPVIVDDTMWLDLVRRGFDPDEGVVWFFKLDDTNNLDPSVAEQLPEGWRTFEYVVSTPFMRETLAEMRDGLDPVRRAIEHSTVVVTFDEGEDRIEIRRIHEVAEAR